MYVSLPRGLCDKYGACGPSGNYDEGKSIFYDCLKEFKPKSPSNWIEMNYTKGCVRDKMKVLDTTYSLLNKSAHDSDGM